jgi:hypothetical protein
MQPALKDRARGDDDIGQGDAHKTRRLFHIQLRRRMSPLLQELNTCFVINHNTPMRRRIV